MELTPMQELLEDLKATKITAEEALEEIKDIVLRSQINSYVQLTLDAVISSIETELLPKEQQFIEENEEMKELLTHIRPKYKEDSDPYLLTEKLIDKYKQH